MSEASSRDEGNSTEAAAQAVYAAARALSRAISQAYSADLFVNVHVLNIQRIGDRGPRYVVEVDVLTRIEPSYPLL